ncbi:hypothetical protein A2W54_03550 [Candidatus Giovannonibacteria bacterium RIFCSPHIGHO2_02_43_13]|uniref:UPF0102 protein A2W54_03550 n=1 Tax=Candidatus Giovannonibacteria bacterium RIFCSPHIGHO2_02_43_13 TaxID=1798330 RepID=A0A1F5WRH9_9BACT|nr:MAG: hypothetical protein UW28_C0004G0053 [Parcubacteria group bacterium GW2011_GWA2_44_13]OGF73961.1 MAG: hypothetical protein A3E06_00760 [Candidatus Giovannonibacteria bacterium RIFCSPHIGHO2_12_FULL_44_42]OGF77851.1 MAG: hypothetical protein A2W54_03550 [Candidatus Giovannonibacteria bacterium RIFCSPHIGHO2_02_43_13]OGF88813.1 MAG: hypothetical protein A3I94_02305 [Candidatus Giovannonibacteria bacterium RIFCSPLOWO2_02_FULL_43_54]OGF96777.1 MAG: hypothetical protein A3H08_01195 [Candidatus
MPKSEKRKIGDIGEEFTCRFLKGRGYKIVERNYLKKWGEIDIVAQNKDGLHFIEVKSLTWKPGFQVSEYMPEANMRLWKKQRLTRAIKTYLLDRKIPDETDFQIDIAAVFLDFERKKARIRMLENIILT